MRPNNTVKRHTGLILFCALQLPYSDRFFDGISGFQHNVYLVRVTVGKDLLHVTHQVCFGILYAVRQQFIHAGMQGISDFHKRWQADFG